VLGGRCRLSSASVRYPARTARRIAVITGLSGGRAASSPLIAASQSILHSALATGISRGFLVGAGIMLVAVLIALVMIRVRRADLAGAGNTPTIEAGQATEPGDHIASDQRPAARQGD
jgi:hypothetical protein